MNCSVTQQMLGSYFDGELDPNTEFQVRLHLSECDSCTATLRRLEVRRQMIRGGDLSYEAPAELQARIRKSIRSERRTSFDWRSWGALAAAILIASTLSVRFMEHRGVQDQLEEQVISSHVRAMMTGHTMDVVSTDRHTVKPWFNGRIDFSPPVNDLAQQGFPLVGARVDYLGGRSVAALVYMRRKHVIDLLVWPARASDTTGEKSFKGYNVIRWSDGGMFFVAVSDLNKPELEQFKSLLSKK